MTPTEQDKELDEILVNLANQIAANEQRLLNGNATREETIDSDSNATMRAEKAIQAYIRTEKLKLLAEVRERVIGENDRGTITNPDSPSYGEPYESTMADKNEQRIALNKLEAEL